MPHIDVTQLIRSRLISLHTKIGTAYASTGYSKSSMPVGGNMSGSSYDGSMPALLQPQPVPDQLKLKIPKDRIKSDTLDFANQSHANMVNSHDSSLTSAPTSSTSLKIKISKDQLEVRTTHTHTHTTGYQCPLKLTSRIRLISGAHQ